MTILYLRSYRESLLCRYFVTIFSIVTFDVRHGKRDGRCRRHGRTSAGTALDARAHCALEPQRKFLTPSKCKVTRALQSW